MLYVPQRMEVIYCISEITNMTKYNIQKNAGELSDCVKPPLSIIQSNAS